MPRKKYYLDSEKTELLQTEWKGIFKNFNVIWNNNVIMTFANKAELSSGKTYRIDDKRELSVQFVKRGWFEQGVEILVNNIPVRGSSTDPYAVLKGTWILLLVLAGLNILIGVIAETMQVNALQNLGIGLGSLIVGVILIFLAVFIKEKQSMIALIIAILLIFADMVMTIVYLAPSHGSPTTSGIYVKIGILIALFRGIAAIRKIKSMNKYSDISPLDQV